jgi:hypothetical protein
MLHIEYDPVISRINEWIKPPYSDMKICSGNHRLKREGKTMKRGTGWIGLVSVLFIAWVAFCMMPASAGATPPANIKLRYDLTSHLLSVTIVHNSMGNSAHYIKFVEIKKNGTVVSINTYNAQPDAAIFSYNYRMNAMEEDTLQAVVTCSQGESRASAVLTVAP